MADLQPGDIITGDSGAEYVIGEPIGLAPEEGTPCDAEHPSMVDGHCRCTVCPRCHRHTGNSHQGHYWSHCKVLAARVTAELPPGVTLPFGEFMKRTTREFHFCCPEDPGCELEEAVPGHGLGASGGAPGHG